MGRKRNKKEIKDNGIKQSPKKGGRREDFSSMVAIGSWVFFFYKEEL